MIMNGLPLKSEHTKYVVVIVDLFMSSVIGYVKGSYRLRQKEIIGLLVKCIDTRRLDLIRKKKVVNDERIYNN